MSVEEYSRPPRRFEEIAVIDVAAADLHSSSDEAQLTELAVRLHKAAGRVGANGIMFQNEDGSFLTHVLTSPKATAELKQPKRGHAVVLAIFVDER